MKDPYGPGGWEPLGEQLSQYRSDGAGNQQDRRPYQELSGVWSFGPDDASGYQRGARRGANRVRTIVIGVVALAVLAAGWIVTHRAHSLRSTPVTAAVTIPVINGTWAPPAAGCSASDDC